MAIPDGDILAFFRRETNDLLDEGDMEFSSDTWSIQPLLFYLAHSINAKTLVEIGVADGSTTVPLAKAADENGGVLHSVDPSGCERALELMAHYAMDVVGTFRFHNMGSDEFFEGFKEQIDFAFIDGDHEMFQVARDIRNCCLRLSQNGLIVLHDFGHSAGMLPPTAADIVFAERFVQEEDYGARSSFGVAKALKLVMPDFPWLSAVSIPDRKIGIALIGRHVHRRAPASFEQAKEELMKIGSMAVKESDHHDREALAEWGAT